MLSFYLLSFTYNTLLKYYIIYLWIYVASKAPSV